MARRFEVDDQPVLVVEHELLAVSDHVWNLAVRRHGDWSTGRAGVAG